LFSVDYVRKHIVRYYDTQYKNNTDCDEKMKKYKKNEYDLIIALIDKGIILKQNNIRNVNNGYKIVIPKSLPLPIPA
jgi:hypothetical protein